MSPGPTKPSLTDILCTQCGLCCDGSLFSDVELAGRAEVSALEILGLDVDDDDGGLLLLPCRALEGTRCSIYPHRPDCCRTFECKLLQEVRHGAVEVDRAERDIADAREKIARVRRLAAALGQRDTGMPLKELFIEALAMSEERAASVPLRKELESAMRAVERLIQQRFLGDSHPASSSRPIARNLDTH